MPAVVVGAAVLATSAPARLARLHDAGPALTVETALADVVVLAGTAAAAYLALTSTLVVLTALVAPRSRALRMAVRLTPRRWRRIALTAAGVAVLVAGASPAVSAQAPSADDRRPDLSGLRLPDRPESPAPVRASTPTTTTTTWVEVRTGDCLWDLARRSLPASAGDADVARSVERWHRANRGRIGPDPDLLLPGTRLRQPRPAPNPEARP
ncbi:LysM peptidoglycan-binding domain-containing protein [Solicola sp. PLA-1-18]|uniref:LysM peptidoglycan-binding domain-containing protein n=1 Tax=Solicola sp. PLA-1-18 TaxID=3380532 RepID=UPI003B823D97